MADATQLTQTAVFEVARLAKDGLSYVAPVAGEPGTTVFMDSRAASIPKFRYTPPDYPATSFCNFSAFTQWLKNNGIENTEGRPRALQVNISNGHTFTASVAKTPLVFGFDGDLQSIVRYSTVQCCLADSTAFAALTALLAEKWFTVKQALVLFSTSLSACAGSADVANTLRQKWTFTTTNGGSVQASMNKGSTVSREIESKMASGGGASDISAFPEGFNLAVRVFESDSATVQGEVQPVRLVVDINVENSTIRFIPVEAHLLTARRNALLSMCQYAEDALGEGIPVYWNV